jgi:hypothetical protein
VDVAAAWGPAARLVITPDAGHASADTSNGAAVRAAVALFAAAPAGGEATALAAWVHPGEGASGGAGQQ